MAFIPANFHVAAPGAGNRPTALVLHGLLGSSRNWRSLTRRLAEARPDWQFVLVDLRNHGSSGPAWPPHTLEAVAGDLAGLVGHIGRDVHAILGHSYGGKAALGYAVAHGSERVQVWLLDSAPGLSAPGDVERVIATAQGVDLDRGGRDAVVQALLDAGFPRRLGDWMATNVMPRSARPPPGADRSPASDRTADLPPGRAAALPGDGVRATWRVDLAAAAEMLAFHRATDLWPAVRALADRVHVVRGARSEAWTAQDIDRLDALLPGRVDVLPAAGHWLHVEAPDALLALLKAGLP